MAKGKNYNRLIHSTKWLQLRKSVLSKSPLCEHCEAAGRIVPAVEVHHRKPVEDALTDAEQQRLMFDPLNLVALCHDCHVKVHIELGRSGKAHTKRRTEKQLREFVKKFLE